MGERSQQRRPLNPFRRYRARQVFKDAGAGASVRRNTHPNPYQRILDEQGISHADAVKGMDLAAYAAKMPWPSSVPRITPAQLLAWVCEGEWQPDAGFVFLFTAMANITPDKLVSRKMRDPAPGAIVEATMFHLERASRQAGRVDDDVVDFLRDEISKAGCMDGMRLQNKFQDNASMLGDAESLYIEYVEHHPQLFRDSEAFVQKRDDTQPKLDDILDRQQRIISFYAEHLYDNVQAGIEPRRSLDHFRRWRAHAKTDEFLRAAANRQYLHTHLDTMGRRFGLSLEMFANRP